MFNCCLPTDVLIYKSNNWITSSCISPLCLLSEFLLNFSIGMGRVVVAPIHTNMIPTHLRLLFFSDTKTICAKPNNNDGLQNVKFLKTKHWFFCGVIFKRKVMKALSGMNRVHQPSKNSQMKRGNIRQLKTDNDWCERWTQRSWPGPTIM